jgi:hypothetical protein
MTLSENDYIDVGIGHLYGPPFLSRFLLYRLLDCNQAILIHHRQESRVSASTHGKVVEMNVTVGWPTIVYVHYCSTSASVKLNDLLELPATEMPVPRSVATIERFNNLTIRIESFDLALTEKKLIAYEKMPRRTMRIRKSGYHVTGPIDVAYWPNKVQSGNVKVRCMKLSVGKWNNETNYNILESETFSDVSRGRFAFFFRQTEG